jgi:hypothetical protein
MHVETMNPGTDYTFPVLLIPCRIKYGLCLEYIVQTRKIFFRNALWSKRRRFVLNDWRKGKEVIVNLVFISPKCHFLNKINE